MGIPEILAKAEELFVFDAGHHAVVETAVQVIEAGLRAQGDPMDANERRVAIQAASVALVVASLDPVTGDPRG